MSRRWKPLVIVDGYTLYVKRRTCPTRFLRRYYRRWCEMHSKHRRRRYPQS